LDLNNREVVVDQKIISLFDRYTHGGMDRRQFMERLAGIAGGAAAASALLPFLENNYASADTISADDARLTSETVSFTAAGETISGYLVRPAGDHIGLPAVVVVHENRGLNPHIRDIARRVALAGFVALAVDYLSLVGGTPADEDQARALFGDLKPADILAVSRGAVAYLQGRTDTSGKVGAVGFCWGGGTVNALAVAEPTLGAAVAYYGSQPKSGVEAIQAPLLLHYAGLDDRINAGIPAFEDALKAAGKSYELYVYANVNHAFNNDTNTARYEKGAADLAWERTITFFKTNLS
jgi:carboxymethylenebutenolidase